MNIFVSFLLRQMPCDRAFFRAALMVSCLLGRAAASAAEQPPCTTVIHHLAVTRIVPHAAVTHDVTHPPVFPVFHPAVTHPVSHPAVTHPEYVPPVTHPEYVPPVTHPEYVQPVTHTETVPAVTHTEYVPGYEDEFGNWVEGYDVVVVDAEAYEVTVVDAEGYEITVVDAEGYTITVVDSEGYTITVVDAEAYDEIVEDEPAYFEGTYQSGYIETVVDVPAWDEIVVDVAAYDEFVPDESGWGAFDEVTAVQENSGWSPEVGTVAAGTVFTQTRLVTRTHSTGERNPCGAERNAGSYAETASETQQAMGMMLVTGGGGTAGGGGSGGGGAGAGFTLTVIGGTGSGTGIAAGAIQQISAQGLAANDQYFTGWSVVSGPATLETSPISWSGSVVMGSGNVVIQANYAQATPGQPFWMDVNNDGIPDEITQQNVAGFTVLFDDFRSEVDLEMEPAFNWQPFNNWFASVPGWFFAPGTTQERFITPEHFYFGFDFQPSFGATITTYCTANLDFPTQAGERYIILTRARNGAWWGSLGGLITSISGETRYASDISQDVTLIPKYYLARHGRIENTPVAGSPSVTRQALEAAVDGGGRYSQTFFKNILAVLDPQTYSDALGGLAGFVTNIVDPGTRTQVGAEIASGVQSLAVKEEWKRAAEHLITPEGLADITSGVVMEIVPVSFGSLKIPTNIPEVQVAREAAKIGATGIAGEEWLAAQFGREAGKIHQHFPVPGTGGRYIDHLSDGVARESKVGRTSLTDFTRNQIDNDVYLRQTEQIRSAEWYFFDSSQTGQGGPTKQLKAYLDSRGIPVYLNGVLLPPGPI
jgi:hypothetical protein